MGSDAEAARRALEALGDHPEPEALELFLREHASDVSRVVELLRRPLPEGVLEGVSRSRPWGDDRRVIGALAQNPRTPRHVALAIVGGLYWRDLALTARNPWVASAVRHRAEALLIDQLDELRLGDRMALARLAPPRLLRLLLRDTEPRVLLGALENPRLQESTLAEMIQADDAPRPLIEAVAAAPRWRTNYAIRRALALQRRTPLAVALGQLRALVPTDLRRLARAPLHPLLCAAAQRLLSEGAERKPRR